MRRGNPFLAVGPYRDCLPGVRIATAPAGPRNDSGCRWSAGGLRLPLSLRGGEADAAIRSFGSWSLSELPARGTDCHGPAALAMTAVVDGLRAGLDFLCHCEEAKPTRQSVLLAVGPCRKCLHGVRIATAPAGPRNDRRSRWSAALAMTDAGNAFRGNFAAPYLLPGGVCGRMGKNDCRQELWNR